MDLDSLNTGNVITTFSGHSGCKVELISRNKLLRVRKSATENALMQRLRTQYEKMKTLSTLKNVKTPSLYDVYDDGKTFFYEMEYCEMSRTFADASEDASLYELRNVVDFLTLLLEELENIRSEKISGSRKFGEVNNDKLRELVSNPKVAKSTAIVKLLNECLHKSNDYFAPIANMESHFCHGDLTLDNILWDVKGGRWLIDPIDCYFEHPWSDISKLFQDLEGEWFQIRSSVVQRKASSNLWRLGAILKEWLREKYSVYSHYHYYFLGLNFVRILPYLDNSALTDIVSNKSELFLGKFLGGKEL